MRQKWPRIEAKDILFEQSLNGGLERAIIQSKYRKGVLNRSGGENYQYFSELGAIFSQWWCKRKRGTKIEKSEIVICNL